MSVAFETYCRLLLFMLNGLLGWCGYTLCVLFVGFKFLLEVLLALLHIPGCQPVFIFLPQG